jgi:hypothetical protein
MFQIGWLVAAFSLIVLALIGLVLGAFTGFLLCSKLKFELRGIIKDGLCGSIGSLAGFLAAVSVPYRNTITYRVGQTFVTSTTNSYQHPERVAIAAAVLLPLLRAAYRFRRERQSGIPV